MSASTVRGGQWKGDSEAIDAFFLQNFSAEQAAGETREERTRRDQKWEVAGSMGPAPSRKGDECDKLASTMATVGHHDADDQPRCRLRLQKKGVPSELPPKTDSKGLREGRIPSSEVDLKQNNIIQESSEDRDADTGFVNSIAPTFEEMVYLRFGCTVTTDRVDATPPFEPLPPAIVAKRFLGIATETTDSNIAISNDAHVDVFCLFLAYCKEAASIFDIPKVLLDSHQPHSKLHSSWLVEIRRAYVALRRSFLRSSRGRAALLCGGIVGRLARSEVSAEEVFRGPNDDARINGICLWDGHSSSAFWDDCLTEHEINLICGVYYVGTGQFDDHGAQTAMLSWWPRPSAFQNSGLTIEWSPMCEAWYRKRLQQVESANGILVTHQTWKDNLKLERRVPLYVEGIDKCSAHILEIILPPSYNLNDSMINL
ncbi:hypothetical protein FB451DRAFT_1408137 [Mycena latifolia]|nr:hypothetical protein FB451DRAFT_1408137 [Mycena latifolia]